MQRLLLLVSLFLLAFAPTARAQQPAFYVNGAAGVNTPLAGIPTPGPLGWTPAAPAPQGWRTIQYAITQVQAWMAAAAPAVPTARIYIQSGQVYSPGTNGEVFPITMEPSIELISSSMSQVAMPSFLVPAGATAITFPSNKSFFYRFFTAATPPVRFSNSGLRYLQFVGGAIGVQMGANSANRHNSIVEWCEFQEQTTAGIQVVTDSGVNDPKFYRNTFSGSFRGVEMIANGTGPSLAADIEECSFLSNVSVMSAGIYLLDNSSGVSSNQVGVGGIFRSNNFEGIQSGVYIEARGGQQIRYPRVFRSRFASIVASAVEARLVNNVGQDLVVTDCVMMNCTSGVKVSGTTSGGSHAWSLSNNTFYQCSRGLDVSVAGSGSATLTTEKHLVRECSQSGYRVNLTSTGSSPLTFAMTSQQDRLLENQRSIELLGSAAGSFTLRSSMVCRGRTLGDALYCSNPNMTLALDGCTLADNSRAINLIAYNAAASSFGHLILDGNSADVIPTAAPAPSFTYSCFSRIGSAYPGLGNLNQVDPQLVRPYFKIALASPCVDAGNALPASFGQDYEGELREISGSLSVLPRRDIGADEMSPNGSACNYGNVGFEQFNVFPKMVVSGAPYVSPSAARLRFDLIDAVQPVFGVPAFGAILFIGQDEVSQSPLPFDLAPLGWPGSYVQMDPFWSSGLVLSGPNGATTLSIGIAPGLTGVVVTAQWFVLMPPPYDIVTSDAARVTVGNTFVPPQAFNMVAVGNGSFQMGSTQGRSNEAPVHDTTIMNQFWIGRYEVTQADYQAVMGSNPSTFQGPSMPVESVTWSQANDYCAALTAQQASNVPPGYVYRLPTEAEWEFACRLNAGTNRWTNTNNNPPICADLNANFCVNATASVGNYAANPAGLYDTHGNVSEWVLDADPSTNGPATGVYPAGPVVDPLATTGTGHIVRGGTWNSPFADATATVRYSALAPTREIGFRIVLAPQRQLPFSPPASLNMVPIQPGVFQMGSNTVGFPSTPVHQVTLNNQFWMGKFEVTQAQYQSLRTGNPSSFVGPNRPVEGVTKSDAQAYCAALTAQQSALGALPAGYVYRLPTEAEWEYCCRAGTTSDWSTGTSPSCAQANVAPGALLPPCVGQTTNVGSYPPNPWGLHDMHGNVGELVIDQFSGSYAAGAATDPVSLTGTLHIYRGGSFGQGGLEVSSAKRGVPPFNFPSQGVGFRIVLAPTLP